MGANIETYGELFTTPNISPEIRRAAQKTAAYAKLQLKTRTPVRTGALRASWDATPAANGILIKNPQHYAGFVELGTRKMRARPMVAPTIPEAQAFFAEQLAAEIGRKLGAQIKANLAASSRSRVSTQATQVAQTRNRATAQATSMTSSKPSGLSYSALTAGAPKALPTPKKRRKR